MSDTQTEKHLKTWDEAILELGSFIRKSKEEERMKETQVEAQEALQKEC